MPSDKTENRTKQSAGEILLDRRTQEVITVVLSVYIVYLSGAKERKEEKDVLSIFANLHHLF